MFNVLRFVFLVIWGFGYLVIWGIGLLRFARVKFKVSSFRFQV
jgi:hypothetical protein